MIEVMSLSARFGAPSARARRVARWALCVALALTGAAALLVGLVAFPVPLFPHHRDLDGVSVRSDQAIGHEVALALAEARHRLESAGGDDALPTVRIYIAHSRRRYGFFCTATGRRADSQALVFSRLGNVILSVEGIRQVRARSGGQPPHSRLEATLGAALAHELAHLQVDAGVGGRSVRSLASWKSEGWADFIANRVPARDDPRYDLRSRARLLLDDDRWQPPLLPADRRHFRWHVLVEYLATVRGLTLAEVADPSVTEEASWRELVDWMGET